MPPKGGRNFSKVSHDYKSNAYAAANAGIISASLALRREWGAAFQEVNSSNDQEPLKYVYDSQEFTHGPGATGQGDCTWIIVGMPPMKQESVSTVSDQDPRDGRTVTLKSLDINWTVLSEYDSIGANIGTLQFRRLIVLDKQPKSGLMVNITTLLSGTTTGSAEANINGMINRDNERRFVILADDTKRPVQYAGADLSIQNQALISWADHIDLNLKTTFDQTAGISADSTANQIFIAYCLSKQAGSTVARTRSEVEIMTRVAFTDV